MASSPPPQKRPAPLYSAYLVRIWQEGSNTTLRASVQAVGEGDIVRFATLDALFDYLNARAAAMLASADRPAAMADSVDANSPDE